MKAMITLIVAPHKNRPGNFNAYVHDRLICTSRQPYYDGARVLLGEGVELRDQVHHAACRIGYGLPDRHGWCGSEAHYLGQRPRPAAAKAVAAR